MYMKTSRVYKIAMHYRHTVFLFAVLLISLSSAQFAYAQVTNLLDNPSAEKAAGNHPQKWSIDTWGSTKAAFTYGNGGAQDGSRYLTTHVTKQGSGDAKWYPKHVSATPGQTYTFSDWYKSDVQSYVEIEYTTNGGYKYQAIGTLAPSAGWKEFKNSFTAPARVKKMTVLHYIRAAGTLSTDSYSLSVGSSTGTGGGDGSGSGDGTGSGGTPTTTPAVTFTISNSQFVSSQQIGVNIPNQPLGGFDTQMPGEAIVVPQMNFWLSTSSAPAGLLTNITLLNENGVVLAGPVDASFDASSGKQRVHFSDTVTLPAGSHTYILKGMLPANYTTGAAITASVNPALDWGASHTFNTNAAVSLPTTTVIMNTMTAKTSSLSISMSPFPAAQSITGGIFGFAFANVQLDATQSGEDLRMNSLRLTANGNVEDLFACQLWDGSTALSTGSNVLGVISTTTANLISFNNSLAIQKGTVKTLVLRCNVSPSAANGHTYAFGVDSAYAYSATGVDSATTFTPSVTTGTGATMTVAQPTLSLTVAPSSPAYQVVAAGATGVTVGVLQFRANFDTMTLTKIGLSIASGSSSSFNQLSIYDGATQVGTAVFPAGSTSATSTFTLPVTLPHDTDKMLTIKADISDIGIGKAGTEGALLIINPLNAEANSTIGLIKTGASGSTSGVRILNSMPIVTQGALPATGVSDGRLLRFSVTANSAGGIGLGKFAFALATSSLNLSDVRLFAYTDPAYSNPISGQGAGGQIGNSVATPSTSFSMSPTTNPVEVPAGVTYYFELHGTVANDAAGSGTSATLLGDTSFDGMKTFDSTNGNFIWSPNATTTSTFLTNDWTNGYALPVLPGVGITTVRGE
jgi:hypothetical protein